MKKHSFLSDNQDLQLFLSCAISSLGMWVATPADQGIFKVLIYSRGVVSLLKLGQESGLYKCVEPNDRRYFTIETFLCIVSTIGLCYAYLYEIDSMKPSFAKSLTRACSLTPDEQRFFDSVRAIEEIRKRKMVV